LPPVTDESADDNAACTLDCTPLDSSACTLYDSRQARSASPLRQSQANGHEDANGNEAPLALQGTGELVYTLTLTNGNEAFTRTEGNTRALNDTVAGPLALPLTPVATLDASNNGMYTRNHSPAPCTASNRAVALPYADGDDAPVTLAGDAPPLSTSVALPLALAFTLTTNTAGTFAPFTRKEATSSDTPAGMKTYERTLYAVALPTAREGETVRLYTYDSPPVTPN